AEVSLARGAARFQSGESGGTRFFADALELRPTAPGTKIDASLIEGGKVNVAVAAGSVDVIAPTGARLQRMSAGQALLFGMAQTAPQGGSQAPAPQGRSGGQAPGVEDQPQKKTNRTALWILLGAGAAGGGAAAALGGGKRGS
ncbi:MAG: hypothetical protein ACRD8O_19020, partial [Bryobacteraceae bacterium]